MCSSCRTVRRDAEYCVQNHSCCRLVPQCRQLLPTRPVQHSAGFELCWLSAQTHFTGAKLLWGPKFSYRVGVSTRSLRNCGFDNNQFVLSWQGLRVWGSSIDCLRLSALLSGKGMKTVAHSGLALRCIMQSQAEWACGFCLSRIFLPWAAAAFRHHRAVISELWKTALECFIFFELLTYTLTDRPTFRELLERSFKRTC